jgi:hypothetical protein
MTGLYKRGADAMIIRISCTQELAEEAAVGNELIQSDYGEILASHRQEGVKTCTNGTRSFPYRLYCC